MDKRKTRKNRKSTIHLGENKGETSGETLSETLSETSGKTSAFTPDDYNSDDGFLTTVWGPMLWNYLHIMASNYPVKPTQKQKKHYRDFIVNLKNVLPCGKCRDNLKKYFETTPLTLSHMKNRDGFSRYIYDLHESVNKMLGKKSALSYEEVRQRYENFRARCFIDRDTRKMSKKTHIGCVEPLYGKKSKCVIRIVPDSEKCESLQIDEKCIKTREPL